jgi:N-succinyldiaminopimelate aminotransferase
MVTSKLRPFGTSVFAEMTRLATEHEAINLSQGFPDFEGPPEIVDAAVRALRSGENQYARSSGHPRLVRAIADHQRAFYGLEWDPDTEVCVFSGATEGIASTLLGLLEAGDEVVIFEPFYDSYRAVVAMAGAVSRFCTLRFPDFDVDLERLEAAITPSTRALVLNTPHNPTGKVFTREELEAIARLAIDNDLVVLADEVYEHLTYDGAVHVPIATLPGMRERTVTLSSAGKLFSFTGWKVGWATGPAPLIAAARAAHQFVTFATATPMQLAVAEALETHGASFFDAQRSMLAERLAELTRALEDIGFGVSRPQGTYFTLADFRALWDGDDVGFARHVVETCGVAVIPPSAFYASEVEEGRHLVRFAFCKRAETLHAAVERLAKLAT